MRLTEEQIKEINEKQSGWDMGIYNEPYKIPNNVKGLVLYQRYNSGGYTGGNCWDDTEPFRYEEETPEFTILDDVLEILDPNISYIKYRKIRSLMKGSSYTSYEYYGNSDDYEIRYIVLEDLYKALGI